MGSGNIEKSQKADQGIGAKKTDTHSKKRNIELDVLPKTVGKGPKMLKPPPGIRDKRKKSKRSKSINTSIQWFI